MKDAALLQSGTYLTDFLSAVEKTDLWGRRTFRQAYAGSAHRDTEAIFFRWVPVNTYEAIFLTTLSMDYPELNELPEVRPLIAEVIRAAEGKTLGRVILVKLKPGGRIVPHIDEGVYADTFERFHLVIKTNDETSFFVETEGGKVETLCRKPGDIYWFNHKKKHWAENKGTTDRIHLIVDCVSEKWRRDRGA